MKLNEPVSVNDAKNFSKKLNVQGRLEQKRLRGEYLPGDLGVISLLAG